MTRTSVARTALALLTSCPARIPLDDLEQRQLLHAHCVPNATRYDDFEQDPTSALLLLAHNTNLGSFPALQRLSYPGLRARPLEFESVIEECKVEINTLVRDILAARPEQLYDARDYSLRQVKYCTTSPARHAVCAFNLKRTLAVHVGITRRTPTVTSLGLQYHC